MLVPFRVALAAPCLPFWKKVLSAKWRFEMSSSLRVKRKKFIYNVGGQCSHRVMDYASVKMEMITNKFLFSKGKLSKWYFIPMFWIF